MPANIAKIKQHLIEAIKSDSLELPTLPEAALKVRQIAESDTSSFNDIADALIIDAALSARIVRVANSPLLRTKEPIDNIHKAVSRLGIDYTCNLAMSFAMKQMFQATSDMIDKLIRESWHRSTEVASISYVLAQHFTNLEPDQAMLGGLIHQIGVLPILRYAEENQKIIKDSITLTRLIDSLHRDLGTYILKAWGFPEDLAKIPKHYLNFGRDSAQIDYVDIVMVATLQSYAGSDHPLSKVNLNSIKAFEKLGLDPEIDVQESDELGEDIEEAKNLFR